MRYSTHDDAVSATGLTACSWAVSLGIWGGSLFAPRCRREMVRACKLPSQQARGGRGWKQYSG